MIADKLLKGVGLARASIVGSVTFAVALIALCIASWHYAAPILLGGRTSLGATSSQQRSQPPIPSHNTAIADMGADGLQLGTRARPASHPPHPRAIASAVDAQSAAGLASTRQPNAPHEPHERSQDGRSRLLSFIALPETVDLGLVAPNGFAHETVCLTNRGPARARIARFRPSCDCLHAWLCSDELAPGERTQMLIWVDFRREEAAGELDLELEGLDRDDKTIFRLRIYANATRDALECDELAKALLGSA
ncbi:MAG TPA: hypothetical protein VNH11_23720 [Pirellulales bacterium]|nr:hypothetical protein [Pirellulales bacterium]